MQHIISQDPRERCQHYGVKIDNEAHFCLEEASSVVLESPSSIRKGEYGIEFVGAFTFLGGRETSMMNIGSIGRFCSIASNIVSGQPEHPTSFLSSAPLFTGSPFGREAADFVAANPEIVEKAAMALSGALEGRAGRITIGNDVWIGEGVFLRAGVVIGDGAVIGARSVVTRDVPPYAVVAGAPARVIRYRFEPGVIASLLELEWWKYGLSALDDTDFTDVPAAISKIERNIATGRADLYDGVLVSIDRDWTVSGLRFDPQTGDFVVL